MEDDVYARRILVFASNVQAARRLAKILRKTQIFGGSIEELSSLQTQSARSKSLERFRSGAASIIVSSDVMARGIDIEWLRHVVNYDPATHAKTYVHRVGRTARAGRTGTSYTLLRRDQFRHFRHILKQTTLIPTHRETSAETLADIEDVKPKYHKAVEEYEASLAKQQLRLKEKRRKGYVNK